MEIITQDWDSAFFGYKVGKLEIKDNALIDAAFIKASKHKLIYLFSKHPISKSQYIDIPNKVADIKLILEKKEINNQTIDSNLQWIPQLSDRLLNLAFQSGEYSRFKLDDQFKHKEFERMYTTWVTKAIENKDGKVLGYYRDNLLVGFITLSKKNQSADIGLIAVDQEYRGKGIGKKLLEAADAFAVEKGLDKVLVNTQQANQSALNFYLNNCYKIIEKTYIYHIWN
jgi:dTDP-4-amino-4,6-dideoxy-D-galactose acyltransferase